MPRKKALKIPQKKFLLSARKRFEETRQLKPYLKEVVRVYRPVIARALKKAGLKKTHPEYAEASKTLRTDAIIALDHYFKKQLKAPVTTVVPQEIERKALKLVKAIKKREAFEERLIEPEEIPARERKRVPSELEFKALTILSSPQYSKYFTEREQMIIRGKIKGLTLKEISQSLPEKRTKERVRQLLAQALKKIKLIAKGKPVKIKKRERVKYRRVKGKRVRIKRKRKRKKLTKRQKIQIRKTEFRRAYKLLRRAGYLKKRYEPLDRGLLKKALNLLPAEEKKLIKYLYGVDWVPVTSIPPMKIRKRRLAEKLKLSREELKDREAEIIAKLKENLKKVF